MYNRDDVKRIEEINYPFIVFLQMENYSLTFGCDSWKFTEDNTVKVYRIIDDNMRELIGELNAANVYGVINKKLFLE